MTGKAGAAAMATSAAAAIPKAPIMTRRAP
jgi:hypothetical protein